MLGPVCYFGVRANHTQFVHIFCLMKNISRTKFQSLIFCCAFLRSKQCLIILQLTDFRAKLPASAGATAANVLVCFLYYAIC
jgi:hypothetical protein